MKNCRDCIMDMLYVEDCCEILDSMRVPITASEREEGEYPYYGANGIQDHIADYIFDDELVLLAEDGGNFGSRERPIAYRVSGKCWVNNHAHVLKPKTGLDVDYLCYSLMFYKVDGMVNGATRQKLTQAAMRKMQIPLRSMDKQKYIVDVLNHIIKLKERRQQELQLLDDLIKARFVEMFGSIHKSTEYPYVAVKDLTDVISGGTPSRDKAEYWEDGTIPWVKTTELQNNIIVNVDEYITEAGLNGSSAKLVPVGTVLVAMYGQGKTRGMTAYLNIEACTNQACACILPSDKIDSMFMWKFFELSYEKIRSLAQGAGQPNLNGNMIKSFQVLVPPIELQKEYVDFVHQVDKSKVVVQKALDETQILFNSLMQQYFG